MFDYVKFDPIRLVEAGFEDNSENEDWLAQLVDCCSVGLGEEPGAVGYLLERQGESWRVGAPYFTGISRAPLEALYGALPQEAEAFPFECAAGASTRADHEGTDSAPPSLETHADVLTFLAQGGEEERVFALQAPLMESRALTKRERELWQCLAGLVGVALDHRGRGSSAPPTEDALQGAARSLGQEYPGISILQPQTHLRALAQTADEVQPEPPVAIEPATFVRLWKGVASGHWSFVDRFDADGRRFVIARKNNPRTVRPGSALSLRERQVVFYAALGWKNPEIAGLLSLAPTTVATHLRRALDKLGLDGRSSLLSIGAALKMVSRQSGNA